MCELIAQSPEAFPGTVTHVGGRQFIEFSANGSARGGRDQWSFKTDGPQGAVFITLDAIEEGSCSVEGEQFTAEQSTVGRRHHPHQRLGPRGRLSKPTILTAPMSTSTPSTPRQFPATHDSHRADVNEHTIDPTSVRERQKRVGGSSNLGDRLTPVHGM